MKPVVLDSEWVKPFNDGKNDSPCVCITCASEAAHWMIGRAPNAYVSCARCFLYTSPWGLKNEDGIRALVAAVEESMGRPISADGFVLPGDADRVLASVVSISGIIRIRSMPKART